MASEDKATVSDSELKLQGIVMHPTKPIAVINRQSVGLNEQVTLKLRSGEIAAKAILIERSRVVLKIGDRNVELRLEH